MNTVKKKVNIVKKKDKHKKDKPIIYEKNIMNTVKKKDKHKIYEKIIKILKTPFTNNVASYFSERIDIYKFFLEYLENQYIKQCINITSKNKYSICNDKIVLYKQIGSKSAYGSVFKSKTNNKNPIQLAVKVMKNIKEHIREVKLLKLCTNYVINKDTPHLPIMYNQFECDEKTINNFLPKTINNEKYLIVLNELAGGDLYKFIHNSDNIYNNKLYLNTFIQIFISIFTFHKKIKYVHTDCHGGNFLFHRIPSGGYIKYSIFGKTYYLENMGYLWVIWDYGLANNIMLGYENYKDYLRILHAFMNVKDGGWIKDKNKINEELSKIFKYIYDVIKYKINYNTKKQDELILDLIIKKTGGFLESIPIGSYVYNQEPYFLV